MLLPTFGGKEAAFYGLAKAKLAQGCFPLFPGFGHFPAKAMREVELAPVFEPRGDPVEPCGALVSDLENAFSVVSRDAACVRTATLSPQVAALHLCRDHAANDRRGVSPKARFICLVL